MSHAPDPARPKSRPHDRAESDNGSAEDERPSRPGSPKPRAPLVLLALLAGVLTMGWALYWLIASQRG
jgi:hypothetical protein